MKQYVVATAHRWNVDLYARYSRSLPGSWHLVTDPSALTDELLDRLRPRFVFFPHWSWRVPDEIVEHHECVCFHMTDVPYGRGGTPLQNLILAGHRDTKVSALRMVSELDAGPVYAKAPLSLAGRAQEIYERAAGVIAGLIEQIVLEEPEPEQQRGEITRFARRTPAQSELPADLDLVQLYDYIRMLDADGYPHAFMRFGRYQIEFTGAELQGGHIRASVELRVTDTPGAESDAAGVDEERIW